MAGNPFYDVYLTSRYLTVNNHTTSVVHYILLYFKTALQYYTLQNYSRSFFFFDREQKKKKRKKNTRTHSTKNETAAVHTPLYNYPDNVASAARTLEVALLNTLETLTLGVREGCGDFQALLSALSIRDGGLGFPLPTAVISYAHLAASLENKELCHKLFPNLPSSSPAIPVLAKALESHTVQDEHSHLHSLVRMGRENLQHLFSALWNNKLRSRLREHPYLRDECFGYEQEHWLFLESGMTKESVASTRLQALPNQGLGQYMTNQQLHSVLTMRLHVAFRSNDKPCEACGKVSDRFGYHALGCRGPQNLCKYRHELVADGLCSWLGMQVDRLSSTPRTKN